MKMVKGIVVGAIASAVSLGAVAAEQDGKFSTEIDQELEQDGERTVAQLQETAINDTVERYDGGVLDGETYGSDYGGNVNTGNSAGDLQNTALEKAEDNTDKINNLSFDISTPTRVGSSGYNDTGSAIMVYGRVNGNHSGPHKHHATRVNLTVCGETVSYNEGVSPDGWYSMSASASGIVPDGCSWSFNGHTNAWGGPGLKVYRSKITLN